MDKKPLIVVSICAVILLVLGSLSNVVGYQITQSSNEKVTIQISYSTLQGIVQIEKEVSRQDAHRLSQLMDNSDADALAYELTNRGLAPSSIDQVLLRDLISGDYGKRQFRGIAALLNRCSYNERGNITNRNVCCLIHGDARDCIYMPALELMTFGVGWTLASLGIYLNEKFPSVFPLFPDIGILTLLGFLLLLLSTNAYFFRISPIRAIPVLFSSLHDGVHEQKTNLNTIGLLGRWSVQSHNLDMLLIGFLGIWITIFDQLNYPGCYFIGFSFYTVAQEYE